LSSSDLQPSTVNLLPITVLGAGSWGTALAIQFARAGRRTYLWGRDVAHQKTLATERTNRRYLPDVRFPTALIVATDLKEALKPSQDILVAVSSDGFRATLEQVARQLRSGMRLAWATKGFELHTGKLPHDVAAEVLPTHPPLAVLSGPTFAREVGAGLPTAMTVAATDDKFGQSLSQSLSHSNFRAYTSTDVIGVEVGGAVKNVLAIGAGMSDALGFGANTRVALITRGLAEMTRLGVALGGERETFMGLAGLGDLVLTCTDNLSRNRRFGLAVASGKGTREVLAEIGQVVEGVHAAEAVHEVAARLKVEMPICEQVYAVLHKGVTPKDAVKYLMSREIKSESEES
jgi:glycerol-3-phosphate dehydrogenase (NAD(P)+)